MEPPCPIPDTPLPPHTNKQRKLRRAPPAKKSKKGRHVVTEPVERESRDYPRDIFQRQEEMSDDSYSQ